MEDNFKAALKYYSHNPEEYMTSFTSEFIPTVQQKKVLDVIPEAIENGKSIAIKSGHGVGKTAIAANIILWFISVYPNPKIICTAPSKGQLLDVLWPELAKWKRNFKFGEDFEWTKTRLSHKNYPEDWFASARTSNKPESLAGVHGEHVLILMDEASGVPQEVYETLEGAETESGALKILLSNPTKTTGGFYDAFHSKKQEFYNFTFSSLDSERVKKGYAEKIARKYGKDSNVYRIRVLGEFPLQEDDVVIGLDTVERAHERFMDLDSFPTKGEEISFGVDVARFGDDEGSIYVRIGDIVIKERILIKKDTMEMASIIANLRKHKYKDFGKAYFNIDGTGVGSGVVDRLRQLQDEGELPEGDIINEVNNGSRAMNTDEYSNIISELWFAFRDFLNDGGALQPDNVEDINNIQQQLCSRKYGLDSKGKIIIEKKELVKKRIKGSPDRADGSILTIADKIVKGRLLYSDGTDENIKDVDILKKTNEEFNAKQSMIDRMKFYRGK